MLGCTKAAMKQVNFNNASGWPLHKEGKRSFIWFRGYKLYGGTEKHAPNIFVPDLVECGSCSCYHPADFFGDCRDDDHRFASASEWK
jgi:hypothetical protein